MVSANIVINQSEAEEGVAGESRSDMILSSPVLLTNDDNTGVSKLEWVLVSAPEDSTVDEIENAEQESPYSEASFTPDVVGSYLIELKVNDVISQRQIVSIRTGTVVNSRLPAEGERYEFEGGWERNIIKTIKDLDALADVEGGVVILPVPTPWFEWDPNSSLSSQFVLPLVDGSEITSSSVSQETLFGLEWVKLSASAPGATAFRSDFPWKSSNIYFDPAGCTFLQVKDTPPSRDYVITADVLTGHFIDGPTFALSGTGGILVSRFSDANNFYCGFGYGNGVNVEGAASAYFDESIMTKIEGGAVKLDFTSYYSGVGTAQGDEMQNDNQGMTMSLGVEHGTILRTWNFNRAMSIDNKVSGGSSLLQTGKPGIGVNATKRSGGSLNTYVCYFRNIKCWESSDVKLFDFV